MKILLSNSIQEFIDGLLHIEGCVVYAFNTWRRKTLLAKKNFCVVPDSLQGDAEAFARYVEKEGIDVLYAQGMHSLVYFWRVRRLMKYRPKLIVTAHSGYMWRNVLKAAVFVVLCAMLSDGIVFIAECHFHKWRFLCRTLRLPCVHIPNPVDMTRFEPKRAEDFDKNGTVVIGTVGVVAPLKGQDVLVKAVKALRKRGHTVDLKIGGDVRDVTYAQETGATFEGQIPYDGIPNWLRQLDIYVCPSLCEVMPFSILEAMATGLPVVASDVGGISELVRNGKNGYLVPSRNFCAIEQACLKIIRNREMVSLGSSGRLIANKEFSFPRFAERVSQFLKSIGA